LECVGAYEGRYIYVDAAYTAEDLARALDALSPYTRGRSSVLIGSVGNRARVRRAPLGKAAAEHADLVYLTADDPDCEDPVAICEDMMEEIKDRERCCVIPDRRKAIERAVLEMRPGDTLLLAGKGGERFQLVCGRQEIFDEREIVARTLLLL
jgi:UDP-N-acetylmuramoyl-L-alanyl-D-glutamate--2,6-diaminopimelate ligase